MAADGSLFAQTNTELWNSSDAGSNWTSISLPPQGLPGTLLTTVDPTDPDILYATGEELLYKSSDRGASWQSILSRSAIPPPRVADPADFRVMALAVSLADHDLLFAFVAGTPPPGTRSAGNGVFALLRSTDGGTTWAVMNTYGVNECFWYVDLLEVHPTNPSRVYLASACRHGPVYSDRFEMSTDEGATFNDATYASTPDGPSSLASTFGYPRSLVGGQGSVPTRWYLAVNRDSRTGGSTLLRSDDDGQTWRESLLYIGGGVDITYAIPGTWEVQIGGVAYDPSNPDRVFVARTATLPNIGGAVTRTPVTSGVTESLDGGATWHDLGSQQLGTITDLVLSQDGQRLYVASDQGVRMMVLGSP